MIFFLVFALTSDIYYWCSTVCCVYIMVICGCESESGKKTVCAVHSRGDRCVSVRMVVKPFFFTLSNIIGAHSMAYKLSVCGAYGTGRDNRMSIKHVHFFVLLRCCFFLCVSSYGWLLYVSSTLQKWLILVWLHGIFVYRIIVVNDRCRYFINDITQAVSILAFQYRIVRVLYNDLFHQISEWVLDGWIVVAIGFGVVMIKWTSMRRMNGKVFHLCYYFCRFMVRFELRCD